MEIHEFQANESHPRSCVKCGRPDVHPIHSHLPTDSQIAGMMYQVKLLLIASGYNMDGIDIWDIWRHVRASFSGRSGGKINDPAPSSSGTAQYWKDD